MHDLYCFGGQAAVCRDYFLDNVLPCVCGYQGEVLSALSEVALPLLPLDETGTVRPRLQDGGGLFVAGAGQTLGRVI